MPRRKAPDDYALDTTILRTIGEGNSVILGNRVIGPITFPEGVEAQTDLVLAGVAHVAAGSKIEFPAEEAFSRIATGVRRSFQELLADRNEARRHSRVFFLLMCVFLATGLVLILAALALLISGRIDSGIISTVASTVFQAATVVLFRKDRELRRVMDSYNGHFVAYHRALAMVDVAETMTDAQTRDKAKHDIIRSLLKVASPQNVEPPQTTDE